MTVLAKSPAGRGSAGRSHGGLPRSTPHSESWSWPHARFGTPAISDTPTFVRFVAQRTLRTSTPCLLIEYLTPFLTRFLTTWRSCTPPTKYGLQRPIGF